MRLDTCILAFLLTLAASLAIAATPARAFSEIQKNAPSTAQDEAQGSQPPAGTEVPAPQQVTPGTDDDSGNGNTPEGSEPEDSASPDAVRPNVDPNAPLPEIFHDLDKLPPAVRAMHDKIVEACKSGDLEKLRPLIGTGDDATQLSLGGIDGDPIDFLHQLAGDEGGQEILAILEMILESGYVHLDEGKPEELYVWPYFFAVPLARLDASQRVELFKIITAGDYEDMKSFGAYVFYRVGITPQGHWAFFVAGD
jgi:hypothetical protein